MFTKSYHKKKSLNNKGQLSSLKAEICDHSAWKGDVSLTKAAEMLIGSRPFTYMFSEGLREDHAFISFVDATNQVKHHNLRIFLKNGKRTYRNGGSGPAGASADLNALLPVAFKCSANQCNPLV